MHAPKEILVLLALTMFLPYTHAGILPADCSQLNGDQFTDCQSILADSSLSLEQKEDLYLNLLANQGELGSFDFAWNWNQGINWVSPPQGVVPQSDGIIRNAWTKITAVDKSFFDLNREEWFAAPSGKVLTESRFEVTLPSGTMSGDCSTNYYLESQENNLGVALNGNPIGSTRITNYSSGAVNEEPMAFQGSLSVRTRLRITHYREHGYCWLPVEWSCSTVCEPDHVTYQDNEVHSSSQFNALAKVQETSARMALEDNPGLSRLFVSLDSEEPLNGFELRDENRVFWLSEARFDLNALNHETVFVTKNTEKERKTRGFVELGFNDSNEPREIVLGATGTNHCSYTLTSDFTQTEGPCGFVRLEPVHLRIETDANSHDFNETIKAHVFLLDENGVPLSGQVIVLSAGNYREELVSGPDGSVLQRIPANQSHGVITAFFPGNREYRSGQATKRVPLKNGSDEGVAEGVTAFFGGYYLVFLAGKKVLGGL